MKPRTSVSIGFDPQIGGENVWSASTSGQPASRLFRRDAAPEPASALRSGHVGHRLEERLSFLRRELHLLQHIAPNGSAHIGRRFQPNRLDLVRRRGEGQFLADKD